MYRNQRADRKMAIQVADTFRVRTFKSREEADEFLEYARKEGYNGIQEWEIPCTPAKYRVAWFETVSTSAS